MSDKIKTKIVNSFYFQYIKLRGYQFKRQLKVIFDRTKNLKKTDIIAVVLVHNEKIRLPFFLKYYRDLGVDHFVFIDHESSDGLADYLSPQKDCSLWTAHGSYNSSLSGIFWTNPLTHQIADGHWHLRLDPDEFLVYPHCEHRNLHDLTEYLDTIDRHSLFTVMVDCYSDKPLEETYYSAGENIFETCPYFDRFGYNLFLPNAMRGGARHRMYYHGKEQSQSPLMHKFPLLKFNKKVNYISSTHTVLPPKYSTLHDRNFQIVTGCLMHYKFISELENKIHEELTRKEHYAGGAEYKKYSTVQSPVFYVDNLSKKYNSWTDLADCGLLAVGDWR